MAVKDQTDDAEKQQQKGEEEERTCSVEEVALIVSETDDQTLPVMTFRAWSLGLVSCFVLIFLNTFYTYRTQPLAISAVLMQISVLSIGKFMTSKALVFFWDSSLS